MSTPHNRVQLDRVRQLFALFTAALIVLALDHLTKWLVVSHLAIGDQYPANGPIVLRHIENRGAAFGLFPQFQWFYLVVAIAVSVYIVGFSHRFAGALWQQAVLGMVLGGAVSNGIDRLAQGHVTDFIDLKVWPIFNVADCAIVVSIAIAVLTFRSPKAAPNPQTPVESSSQP